MLKSLNKTKVLLITAVAIALLAGGFAVFKQSNTPLQNLPTGETFNFIFKYGVGAKNILNTFRGTYTKDMVMDPPVTINLKLTDKELAGIYQKINSLKLLEKKKESVETGGVTVITSPCSSYYLKVQINDTQKELFWDNCYQRISDKFQQFTNYIIPIIESREEYKKLPNPRGGYL